MGPGTDVAFRSSRVGGQWLGDGCPHNGEGRLLNRDKLETWIDACICYILLIGLFMALQPKIIACGNSIASFAMAVRFLTGPAVMAAASIAVGLRGTLLHIAIVQVIK